MWLEELGEKLLGDLGGIASAANVNGPDGIRDIEGKVTRVGARMEPRGRERHGWANREVEMGGRT